MPFTGQLGTTTSQPSQLEPGAATTAAPVPVFGAQLGTINSQPGRIEPGTSAVSSSGSGPASGLTAQLGTALSQPGLIEPGLGAAIAPGVVVNRLSPQGTSLLNLGVTYVQHNLESYGNAASLTAGSSLLTAFPGWRRQHTQAFGITTSLLSGSVPFTISGATNASPISITATGHPFVTGLSILIAGVGGNTAANGTWTITSTGANTFTLNGSTGNGTYTSGGTARYYAKAISAATNASPIVITSTAHGIANGLRIHIDGVQGNTAANGNWTIAVVDADHYSLTGSTGNGTYTSGGTAYPYNFAGTNGSASDEGLDQRVARMKANGGTSANMTLIVLGTDGVWCNTTPNTLNNTPPTVTHYQDYYDTLTETANRYSTPSGYQNDNAPILNYEIWNEIEYKGFSGNISGYCTFYTGCANALRAVNPNIKIGGPYCTFNQGSSTADTNAKSQLSTFLSTVSASLIDFIVFDWELTGPYSGSTYTAATYLSNMSYFSGIMSYVRSLTSKEVRVSEYYWNWDTGNTNLPWSFQAAWYMYHAITSAVAGVAAIAHWQPEAEQNQGTDSSGQVYPAGTFPWNPSALFSTTRVAGGGQAFPSYTALTDFASTFPAGTAYYPVTTNNASLVAMASATKTLVQNISPAPITTVVEKQQVTLPGYGYTIQTAAAPVFTLSGTGTAGVPTGTGIGFTTIAPATLSGSGTAGVPTGTGIGFTTIAPATLSGSGIASVPTGSGTGFVNTAPAGLSGSGTAGVPTGSGAGFVNTAPTTITLSGSGITAVPTGSGTGITSGSNTISGSGTTAPPTGSGAGLFNIHNIFSGAGTTGIPTGSGTGFITTRNALSGTGSGGLPFGSGVGFINGSANLSGAGTTAIPTGSGSGLSNSNTRVFFSGSGFADVPIGTGDGLITLLPAALSGVGFAPAPTGNGNGLVQLPLPSVLYQFWNKLFDRTSVIPFKMANVDHAATGPTTGIYGSMTGQPLASTATRTTMTLAVSSTSSGFLRGTLTDHPGTIATAGVAQLALAANPARKYLYIENLSTQDLWWTLVDTNAQVGRIMRLAPGKRYESENFVSQQAVYIWGSVQNQAFGINEG